MDSEIKLEKDNTGETAKGILLIKADKNLKIRKLRFSVCGKERYEEYGNFGVWTDDKEKAKN
jgi:hypothetical protein